jgi:hypothetical protein
MNFLNVYLVLAPPPLLKKVEQNINPDLDPPPLLKKVEQNINPDLAPPFLKVEKVDLP